MVNKGCWCYDITFCTVHSLNSNHMISSTSKLPLASAAIVSLSLPIDAASSRGIFPSLSAACRMAGRGSAVSVAVPDTTKRPGMHEC